MYWEQTAVVRTEHGITEEFKIKKGVRQGCVLSPSLFNLYTEKIFREIEDMEGVNVGGHNINNLNEITGFLFNRIDFLLDHKLLPVHLTWLHLVYGKMFSLP